MSHRSGTLAPEGVRSMFDRIAPVYDTMNRVMTAGLDRRWRRETVRETVKYLVDKGERIGVVTVHLYRPFSASDFRYVVLLCLYHRQVMAGELPESNDPEAAERWADTLLTLEREDAPSTP